MDKYKPMKILGEGSFGKVYLMRHIQKRELCCLKVMKIKKLSKTERENCKNEVQLMKQVSVYIYLPVYHIPGYRF